MYSYQLHKVRTIVTKFESKYVINQEEARNWLTNELNRHDMKIRRMVMDLLTHRYPEVVK